MANENRPIDFVVVWVDGADPAWLAEKEFWLSQPEQQAAASCGAIDAHAARYRDWDNLRYWFRGVETFAPWVNRIHFVTWGHVPAWLNTEHPKLHVVNHCDYIPQAYLPTFSSHPIELNMHRIEGLSEQFVYFNDDFFLTAPVVPEDFFSDGLPRDALSESPVACAGTQIFRYVRVNDTSFLNRHFSRREAMARLGSKWFSPKVPRDLVKNLALNMLRRQDLFGLAIHHLPQPFLKTTLEEVWQLEPELFHQTCTHKFRHVRDVSQFSCKHYQLLSGKFLPYNIYRYGKAFCDSWDPAEAARIIQAGKYKMICLNDSADTDFEASKEATNAAFEALLPEKCGFER